MQTSKWVKTATQPASQPASMPAGVCVDLASLLISQEIYLRIVHTNLYAINILIYIRNPRAHTPSFHGAGEVLLIAQALIANGAEYLLENT